ncbi:MAG: beta-lactamase family protein [Clostridiales bacterium]|nr:beta-lactamase family protein [Clostridiales bacterium]
MLITYGKTDCTPEEVGYNSKRIENVHKHFERLINEGQIKAGAYCVSQNGKVFMHGAVSPEKVEDKYAPFKADTVNYIASVTKIITATAIMKLVEDGKIRLDQQVGDILLEFAEKPFDDITIFNLLTHTSGLHGDYGSYPNPYGTDQWELIGQAMHEYLDKSPEDRGEFNWIKPALKMGKYKNTWEEWCYCSFGFVLLGEIITRVLGVNAQDYIMGNIIKPLGMNDTAYNLTQDMASRYFIQGERDERIINGVLNPNSVETRPYGKLWEKIPATAGGLKSTVYDMTRFGNALLHNGRFNGTRILGRKAVEKMTATAIDDIMNYCWGSSREKQYGIGCDKSLYEMYNSSEGTYYHEGAGACALHIDPVENVVVAYFVPYKQDGWYPDATYSTLNVLLSGLEK